MAQQIFHRYDTKANWEKYNPILGRGEHGYESDTEMWKCGDGVTRWNNLKHRGLPCVQVKGQSLLEAPSQKLFSDEVSRIDQGFTTANTEIAKRALQTDLTASNNKIVQLEQDQNKNVYDFGIYGITPKDFSDALNKTVSFGKDGIILKGRFENGEFFSKIYKEDNTLQNPYYKINECWFDTVPDNLLIGVLNLSLGNGRKTLVFDTKEQARKSIPKKYTLSNISITYNLKIENRNVVIREEYIGLEGASDYYIDKWWRDKRIGFSKFSNPVGIEDKYSNRVVDDTIVEIWFDKTKLSQYTSNISLRGVQESTDSGEGGAVKKNIWLDFIKLDGSIEPQYIGWTTGHNRDFLDILPIVVNNTTVGFVAAKWRYTAGYNSLKTIPGNIYLDQKCFDKNSMLYLSETINKYLHPQPQKTKYDSNTATYTSVEGTLSVSTEGCESAMLIVDNVVSFESVIKGKDKQLSGVINLIRLFNFTLNDDVKRLLGNSRKLPSIISKGNTLAYTSGYKSDRPRYVDVFYRIDSIVESSFPTSSGFNTVRLLYEDGTKESVLEYKKWDASDIGVIKSYIVLAKKPVKGLEFHFYNQAGEYQSANVTKTLEAKDACCVKEFECELIQNDYWFDTFSNDYLEISSLQKNNYEHVFETRSDMYKYGGGEEKGIVGCSCFNRIDKTKPDAYKLIEQNARQLFKLSPFKEILLGEKRYLGCYYGVHYSVEGSYILKSVDAEKWTTILNVENYGQIWRLDVSANNRIIIATQNGGADNNGLFVSDTNGENLVKKITWTATMGSTVSTTQDIHIHNNIILVGEYDSGPYAPTSEGGRTGAKVWMSKDFGETFKLIFDGHKHPRVTSVPDSAGYNHVHGAFYDQYWDRVWIACGDRELSGLLWSDQYWDRVLDDDYSDYQFCQYNKTTDSELKAYGVPQPTGGYALPNVVVLGTDAPPNGIFAFFRASKGRPVFERVLAIGEDKNEITVIPKHFHQSSNDKPLYFEASSVLLEYNRVYATFNGVDYEVVWEDNVPKSETNVNNTLEKCYCWDDGDFVWVSTRGYNDSGVRKLLKCRAPK